MGYDAEENIGVDKCNLSEFFESLKGQLKFVTGLLDIPAGLTLEDIRRPNLVLGDPGIGKTCGIVSILEELNASLPADRQLKLKKILLGQTVVGSLSGIPVVNANKGEVIRVQADDLPTVERDGEYGVLFLDEITTADEAQVQPALGLCDDTRNIGTYQLPEHWVVVGAGNGPSCANFLELHDMTLSRFVAFDIKYDFRQDWRPWARAHNINALILAFLNFKPEFIVQVVTNDVDKSGKQFACPRTWTRLSAELAIRAALGKPVSQSEIQRFASRIIGIDAAREFAAFTMYNQTLDVNYNDILLGDVKSTTADLSIEAFHIILQQLIKRVEEEVKEVCGDDYSNCPDEIKKIVANVIVWLISFKNYNLDKTIQAVLEFTLEVPVVASILADDNFENYCPEYGSFIEDYSDTIMSADLSLF